MAIIKFSNGVSVNFNGTPTQADVEEVAARIQSQQTQQPQANPYGATFRATGQETGLQAGAKALGNVPTSMFNFGKNIYSAVTNPVDTLKGVGGAITDFGRMQQNVIGGLFGSDTKRATPTLDALGSIYKDRYGSLDSARKTSIEDPFGVGADILGVLQGGAAVAGKTTQLNNALSKTAQVATAPVRVPVRAATNAVGATTRFGVSQATGLSPDTVSTITQNPKAFGAAQAEGMTRTDLATDVFGAIQKASDDLSDLGSGYDSVRSSGQIVSLPENWVQSALDDFGFNYNNRVVTASRTSKTRNVTDINKIQAFVDNWGDARNFTAEEYLNMRHDLAEMAKYDMAGSTVARDFASRLREGVLNDDKVRGQVPGLKDLDAQYAQDVKFYKQMKKDFLNADGSLKDGAASKVVNAVNASNPERLARLEQLYPGFTQQAKVVKALEDVENAMGLKVGTYARAGVGVAGLATGNLPLILGAVLATPEVMVPLLKGLGYTSKTVAPILKAVRDFSSDINNFRVPGAVQQYIEKNYKDGVPVGLSIKPSVTPESVARKVDAEDLALINKFIEEPQDALLDDKIMRLIEEIGIAKADEATQLRFLNEVKDLADNVNTTQTTALLEEAKKYKSAEEFVKAQPKFYHGGEKIESVSTRKSRFQNTFYFTESPDYAKSYGGKNSVVNEIYLDPSANLADLRNPSEELVNAIADKLNGKETGKIIKITRPNGTVLEIPEIKGSASNPVYTNKQILQGIVDGKAMFIELPEVKKILKEMGYDGLISTESKMGSNYGVWNADKVKTRKEMEDLWNKS